MKEAYLYERVKDETVRCLLCSHRCLIRSGDRGMCNVRENRAATLFTLVYDKIIARNADPIEKKPIYHFLPGTRSYSIATPGCNFKCTFCQNADISQMPSDLKEILGEPIPPEQIVQDALATGCATISYTYTEPTVYFELALDTAVLATSKGLKNVFVTNGYMTRECLERIHPHLHAANVDLKAFRDEFYKKQCRAKLGPVLESIQTMKEMGIWVEVTTLLIPGL
ncbi:MAG TPA: AmmeMemoRadiSam system radical SAM enzyme, partial [Desulfobacterales bacterium]|nr:AmmeMemoRadiSam system radical SAM enzyme [Desulfobacterales bacterium]